MDANARLKLVALTPPFTRPNATVPAASTTARQNSSSYKTNGGVDTAAQESDSNIGSWRRARDAVARKLSPSTENVSSKGITSTGGASSSVSKPVEQRSHIREEGNLGPMDERNAPCSAGARTSIIAKESKDYFSRAPASTGQSLRGNMDKGMPLNFNGTVRSVEEKNAAKSSSAGRWNLTTDSSRGNGENERESSGFTAHGRPFSRIRSGENVRGDDRDIHPSTREVLGGGRGVPQTLNGDRGYDRNENVHSLRQGQISQRQSSPGTSYAASRAIAFRARSQPGSHFRSKPLENEDLMRFLGAYGTPPRRATTFSQLQQMDNQPRDLKKALIPSYFPHSMAHRSLYATTPPSNKYHIFEEPEYDHDEGSKLLEDELSSLLSGLEVYQKRLERAALVVSLERQRRRRY
ncbi:hypothetical protein TraAM80_04710 [Trypanosoma rangeli]|uniref:Uncharacterized protein n=1 Tax=Trypanosoma rangeli TaxID=5698 RepID=A0A422NI46_TRYRA|nr:uncharacterized protein TraAM80_04710 [Trypanosoma rangeli]RNF05150.1 hypothetical protein TraAM80_04710 [Trypanosoma rangeli]|eukprot:RNF05150.1 hypothetical protein TraAM80_04710 [Trypanosoma rangeli]